MAAGCVAKRWPLHQGDGHTATGMVLRGPWRCMQAGCAGGYHHGQAAVLGVNAWCLKQQLRMPVLLNHSGK